MDNKLTWKLNIILRGIFIKIDGSSFALWMQNEMATYREIIPDGNLVDARSRWLILAVIV